MKSSTLFQETGIGYVDHEKVVNALKQMGKSSYEIEKFANKTEGTTAVRKYRKTFEHLNEITLRTLW